MREDRWGMRECGDGGGLHSRGLGLVGKHFADEAEALAGVQSHGVVGADLERGCSGDVFVVREREAEASVLVLWLRHWERASRGLR